MKNTLLLFLGIGLMACSKDEITNVTEEIKAIRTSENVCIITDDGIGSTDVNVLSLTNADYTFLVELEDEEGNFAPLPANVFEDGIVVTYSYKSTSFGVEITAGQNSGFTNEVYCKDFVITAIPVE